MNTLNTSRLVFFSLCLITTCALADGPADNVADKVRRIPPPGVAISESDRAELNESAAKLAKEIEALRGELKSKPALLELLPDVEIFHKAVDWALRYDEFYRSNEAGLARALLKQGMERARQLHDGKPTWLNATGLVVRGYISKSDGSVQPYGLVVPATFSSESNKARRLDVWLHGRDNNLTELKFISDRQRSYGEFTPTDTIVLHPYGRYCNAFKFAGEVDVFEAMEHVKKSYRIDERRIALRGFSMGGAGVWHLAAHHPDVWTVAAPGAGFAETAEYTKALTKEPKPPAWEQKLWQLYDATDYAANFFNLPVVAYNGTDDPQRQAADVMERAMKVEGLTLARVWGTNVGHKYTPEGKKEVSAFVDQEAGAARKSDPVKIHFTTRTLRYNKAPTIEVLALENHWQRASLEFDAGDGSLWRISTTNVSAFRIGRHGRAMPKSVLVDGQQVSGGIIYSGYGEGFLTLATAKADGKWNAQARRASGIAKIPGLQGPIDDAFMDSFLVVRPAGNARNARVGFWTSSALAKATNEWRAQFRGDARVKDDSQVSDADIAAHNLVLFGDPQSNRLLARIADKLPIRWSDSSLKVGQKTFDAATHIPVLIFPNPLNQKRYVVVNSGFTFPEAGKGSNAQQTPKLPDYAVLDVANNGAVALADFFDEQWRLR